MPDWKTLGAAHGLSEEQVEAAAPKLEALEAALTPAFAALPLDTEPATAFQVAEAGE